MVPGRPAWRGGMGQAKVHDKTDWVACAHGLGDDLSTAEWALLAQLAGVLDAWPARNQVARRALDHAAQCLQQLAVEQAGQLPAVET